ncbi:MAG TPA: hypothetical protein EYG68_01500 [Leucothrix mucor]|nr:hypothetical protein [Leucothrix mucor]
MRMLITTLTIAFLASFISVCFAKEEHFCSNQILAKETNTGFTWTLTSRLGEILHNAEQRYGKRDTSWTILGIEFTNQNQPEIWYPSPSDGRKHVIIQLTKKASQDKKSALYQLSHEVIHLLSPAGRDGSSVFEEGLAVYFSISNMQAMNYDISERYISGKKYLQAYKLIDNLYKNFDNAEARIKQLRSQVKRTRDITPQQFSTAFGGLNKKYAKLLATKYSAWKF